MPKVTNCNEPTCGKSIIYLKTKNDKWCPVDADTVEEGYDGLYDTQLGHVSHFKTCTKADKFTKSSEGSDQEKALYAVVEKLCAKVDLLSDRIDRISDALDARER